MNATSISPREQLRTLMAQVGRIADQHGSCMFEEAAIFLAEEIDRRHLPRVFVNQNRYTGEFTASLKLAPGANP